MLPRQPAAYRTYTQRRSFSASSGCPFLYAVGTPQAVEVYHEVRKETNLYGGRLRAPPALDGQDGRLSAVADLQLFEDPVQVRLHRGLIDEQLAGDLAVAAAAHEQGEDLVFSPRQLRRPAGRRHGGRLRFRLPQLGELADQLARDRRRNLR